GSRTRSPLRPSKRIGVCVAPVGLLCCAALKGRGFVGRLSYRPRLVRVLLVFLLGAARLACLRRRRQRQERQSRAYHDHHHGLDHGFLLGLLRRTISTRRTLRWVIFARKPVPTRSASGSEAEKLRTSKCLPVYTRKRTNSRRLGMSALCHDRTHALQQQNSVVGSSRPRRQASHSRNGEVSATP